MSKVTNQTFQQATAALMTQKARQGVSTITENDFDSCVAETKPTSSEVKDAFGGQWPSMTNDAKQAYLATVGETLDQQFPRSFPCASGKARCFSFQTWAKNASSISDALPKTAKNVSQMSDMIAGRADISTKIIETAYEKDTRKSLAAQGYRPVLSRLEYAPGDKYVATLQCEIRGSTNPQSGRKVTISASGEVLSNETATIEISRRRQLNPLSEY